MTRYQPPIRRKETAKGHYYVDATGARVPGVTTILSDGLPKGALVNWAANATADAAVNRWDDLATLPPAQRLKALQGARYEDKDRAAKRGTEVHAYAEQLVRGETVTVPDELAGHVESYARFLDAFKVEPVHIEFSVASHRYGYAGTGDGIVNLTIRGRKVRALVDVKTNRSGIFGETALQLSAYRYADVIIPADGPEQPMPEVEETYAIHVRGDGADLIPVTTGPDQFRAFLYAQQIAAWSKHDRDLIGAPVRPDDEGTPYRLVRAS